MRLKFSREFKVDAVRLVTDRAAMFASSAGTHEGAGSVQTPAAVQPPASAAQQIVFDAIRPGRADRRRETHQRERHQSCHAVVSERTVGHRVWQGWAFRKRH